MIMHSQHVVYTSTMSGHAALGIFALVVGIILAFMAIFIGVGVLICWILYDCLKRVPPQFRQQEPGLAWLLLIPFFGIVWNFFVFLPLARSYQSYFYSRGRTDLRDCGYNISLAYCICAAISIIPYLGLLAFIPSLILLIISLARARALSRQIEPFTEIPGTPRMYYGYPSGTMYPPPPGPPAQPPTAPPN